MKIKEGGVCFPIGFKANGIHAGIRKNKTKKDLSLIFSEKLATSASVYTTNLVKGAPLLVTKKHLKNGYAQAIICNSGNANTCNADGVEIAEGICDLLSKEINIPADDIIVASTGVIGMPLELEPFENGMKQLVCGLDYNKSADASEGILTTDTKAKEVAISFEIDGVECRIGGVAKGSGMIHPNMATMLVFITTDCAISSEMLKKALSTDIQSSFNMLSVDGDTSTNDMVSILANGMAGNKEITCDDENFAKFMKVLNTATVSLCKQIVGDGEGATKLLECSVTNAKTLQDAKLSAKSVICSSLFKSAMFGADANWGRVICAIGYSKANVDVEKVDISFESKKGYIEVCKNGAGIEFSEEFAKEVLLEEEIIIHINLNDGKENALAWGCDLTYDYVKINGDYRT
ncbi:MAG: bifunctional glutamate N-acetyltransferase/amino-acid acetyltransferase ArgJ [Bacillota bacterium]